MEGSRIPSVDSYSLGFCFHSRGGGGGGGGEMAGDVEMGGCSDLLHASTKLVEQAASAAHFPPLQRNLDQLETLSKKLRAKTVLAETPTHSIAATRLLARDLKSFELKTTYEDVFPSGATTVEEYLQQVEQMRVKRRDSEHWMHHQMLPQDLRERFRRYDQYKWLKT